MPRLPRLNLPGLFHHIIVRGIERRMIFRQPSDQYDFLRRLGEGLEATQARCFAWALMSNHLHLLILSGVNGIVELMHPLLTGYAVTFNLKYKRAGHLFQNRYKSIICQEENYFLQLVRYIVLNPVRAGMVKTLEALSHYRWTSHSVMTGQFEQPWLQKDSVFSRFGSTPKTALPAYEQYVRDGWNLGFQDRLEGGGLIRSIGGVQAALEARQSGNFQLADTRILGDGGFVEKILRMANETEEKVRTASRQWTSDSLQSAIARLSGVDEALLATTNRSRPITDVRALLTYAAIEWLRMKPKQLQQWLRLSATGVSRARSRGRDLALSQRLWENLHS